MNAPSSQSVKTGSAGNAAENGSDGSEYWNINNDDADEEISLGSARYLDDFEDFTMLPPTLSDSSLTAPHAQHQLRPPSDDGEDADCAHLKVPQRLEEQRHHSQEVQAPSTVSAARRSSEGAVLLSRTSGTAAFAKALRQRPRSASVSMPLPPSSSTSASNNRHMKQLAEQYAKLYGNLVETDNSCEECEDSENDQDGEKDDFMGSAEASVLGGFRPQPRRGGS